MTKPVELHIQCSNLNELNELVSDAVFGKADYRSVHKRLRKEIRRAKACFAAHKEIELRLMMGTLLLFGPHRVRAARQYKAILRKSPDSVEARIGLADAAAWRRDYQGAMQQLEAAREIAARLGDSTGQLDALDGMIDIAHSQNVADFYAQMTELLHTSPDADALNTMSAMYLLMEGRGPETVSYLEALLGHIIKRNHSYAGMRIAMKPLVGAYCQCGLSVRKAHLKLEQFRELCPDDLSRDYLNRAISCLLQPDQYVRYEEEYGIKREWFDELAE